MRSIRLPSLRPASLRLAVQSAFFALVLFLGFQFWLFVRHFELGLDGPVPAHPAGVEAFLPIGGLTGLRYWTLTGEVHPLHPASVFLLLGALLVSIVLKKSFCGWICPVGFFSERLYKPWQKYFRKNIQPPRWLDIPLRGLKYLLLGFFAWAIGYAMDAANAHAFLEGDYWKIADVKMLRFFTDISTVSLITVSVLILLSIPIRNFWCRYLCPYGALLGLTGLLSPVAITRDNSKCTHCKKCTRNCPAYLPIEASARIRSPECTSCLTCLTGCPKGALSYSLPRPVAAKLPAGSAALSPRAFAALLLCLFFGVISGAKLTGHWESQVAHEDLRRLVPQAEELAHPR